MVMVLLQATNLPTSDCSPTMRDDFQLFLWRLNQAGLHMKLKHLQTFLRQQNWPFFFFRQTRPAVFVAAKTGRLLFSESCAKREIETST